MQAPCSEIKTCHSRALNQAGDPSESTGFCVTAWATGQVPGPVCKNLIKDRSYLPIFVIRSRGYITVSPCVIFVIITMIILNDIASPSTQTHPLPTFSCERINSLRQGLQLISLMISPTQMTGVICLLKAVNECNVQLL